MQFLAVILSVCLALTSASYGYGNGGYSNGGYGKGGYGNGGYGNGGYGNGGYGNGGYGNGIGGHGGKGLYGNNNYGNYYGNNYGNYYGNNYGNYYGKGGRGNGKYNGGRRRSGKYGGSHGRRGSLLVLTSRSSVLAQEYCKKGCPSGLRADLWQTILDVDVTNVDKLYYDQLKQAYLQHDLLSDLLYYKDIKLTATNDDQYFVFEDYIFMVLLPFSRDTQLLDLTETSINTPLKSFIRGKLGMPEYSVIYPPNGIIPFYGFSMLVAPLCYVFDDIHMLYYMFREMYLRYFHKLHVISSERQSILGLASTFESALQTQEPQLFFHLKNHDIHPLRIVFKWLMRAFSGFLSSGEVLRLWDKIFAYDSLEVLSVLAVAIFSFRKLNLLQVRTQGQAEAVLADLTTVKVTPLIQLSLFTK